jgi:alkanesulfonate monooxygenase SsuD/methylene tetrahydromethanopterin reductase-like flavin-dependent oxidoreductase (luciferase family)
VDALSNGRVLFGIGYGWNKEEMGQHGTPYTERRAILRENILAMKQLWTNDEASFEGEHVSIEPSWSWPKPAQTPHPPIILGGDAGPRTAADIAEFCDGWMPIGGRHSLGKWDEVQRACAAIGRDPDTIERGIFYAPTDEDDLEALAAQGISRAVLPLPQGGRDEVLSALDAHAPLIDRLTDA